MIKKKIAVIGAGISGLSAAAYAAKEGYEVHVFEKHNIPGGRARQFETKNGFVFDMGPSWYWMPDIIDQYFLDFGNNIQDFLDIKTLDPQFEIIFDDAKISLPNNYSEMRELFENIEKGAAKQLDAFMKDAEYKYNIGMREFVIKPCNSWTEFASFKILKSALKLDLLSNFRDFVAKYFRDKKLRTIMEFPVIFLGASPKNIPALYSLMNFGGYKLGTHYPIGGFYQLILAMKSIAEKQGVNFHFNSEVQKINIKNNLAQSLIINNENYDFDFIIASSDYHHTETLLEPKYRNYTEDYWSEKTFAPSCLIYYLGIKGKIKNLKHHTLFFENDMDEHIDDIYKKKKWPENPLFYVCCPSKTDTLVAPIEDENIFLLIPTAIHLENSTEINQKYLSILLERIENHTGEKNLKDRIVFQRCFGGKDFATDYNAYGGNAYGLANTLNQTAILKPKIKNKKIKNLFYTGQLTVPGPGVPPSLISGKIVANEIKNAKNI